MRKIYAIICAGCISCTSFAVYAQPGDMESAIQQIVSGNASSGISVANIVQSVGDQVMDMSTNAVEISTIEGPLVISADVPETNRTVVTATDTRTGRYSPRLKINFAEFPLRSFTETTRSNNGRNVQTGTPTEIIARRIQDRLRVPEFDLAIADRTAIISGTVETERQRKLIESMLRFEPGISAVRNEIKIVP